MINGGRTPPIIKTASDDEVPPEWVDVDELTEIHEFDSLAHFARFEEFIRVSVRNGNLEEVRVGTPYASLMFDEKWYRAPSGRTWRLVKPDFPFKGVFLKVDG